MQGLRKGDGSGVTGHTPSGTAWENQVKKVELELHSYRRMRRGVANNLSDIFPQGGDEGVPSGGVPGKGRDADSDEGTFMAQKCTGRCDHLGGGKPPSSNMSTTSRTCLRQKYTLIAFRVPALPGHPSTGHSLVPPLGKYIR